MAGILNLDGLPERTPLGKSIDRALQDAVDHPNGNAFEAEIDTQGAHAEVSTTNKGWTVAGFGSWVRGNGWNAGGKVKKTW
jgi:hypothetical protein